MNNLYDMGGYEFYVWASVGLGLAVIVWNLLAPAVQRRAVLARLGDDAESEDSEEST